MPFKTLRICGNPVCCTVSTFWNSCVFSMHVYDFTGSFSKKHSQLSCNNTANTNGVFIIWQLSECFAWRLWKRCGSADWILQPLSVKFSIESFAKSHGLFWSETMIYSCANNRIRSRWRSYVNLSYTRLTWVFVRLVAFAVCVLLVPVKDASDEGRDERHLGLGAGHGLGEGEQQRHVAVNAVLLLQLPEQRQK